MKICKRALKFVQIIDHKGTVRLCGWIKNEIIGCLSDNTMEEIYHSECANALREKLSCGDYSDCYIDACPYLAMNTIEDNLVEIDEVPQFPEELYLAFEEVCNYRCVSCTTPHVMCQTNKEEAEKGYDLIEERLRDVLPHVKTLSANGRGELFASKRTLKMLSEWKPLAPKEEITVVIESNGSLFDEEHWKQIENIGQYNVRVAITVMSFDETTYQILSGCKLPISQIENNLRFIKGLRDKGIVNYFEIATVVQERNFRTLPEFTRRCVEEFGADYVRLRPYMPWGSQEPHVEWFMNVRNPLHPYYEEYREMWKDPIFQHPKVYDWSGQLDSEVGTAVPYKVDVIKKRILLDLLLKPEEFLQKNIAASGEKNIVIYGLGEIGKAIISVMKHRNLMPLYVIERNNSCSDYLGVEVHGIDNMDSLNKDVQIVITPLLDSYDVKDMLQKKGFSNFKILADCYMV